MATLQCIHYYIGAGMAKCGANSGPYGGIISCPDCLAILRAEANEEQA